MARWTIILALFKKCHTDFLPQDSIGNFLFARCEFTFFLNAGVSWTEVFVVSESVHLPDPGGSYMNIPGSAHSDFPHSCVVRISQDYFAAKFKTFFFGTVS